MLVVAIAPTSFDKNSSNMTKLFSAVIVTLICATSQWAYAQSHDAPPPPPPRGDLPRQHVAAPATRPLSKLAPGETRLAIQFNGGHDTDPRDHGRPVTLIAAALKVPQDVFRQTFKNVHPAGPGSGGPTEEEARQNKAALMAGLSPYGVTDERLNAVSNYYRYMKKNHDDLWQHRDAIAYAIVKDNKVVRFDIPDSGAGYTSQPKGTIASLPAVNVTGKLHFGTDLQTNGSIESLSQ